MTDWFIHTPIGWITCSPFIAACYAARGLTVRLGDGETE